MSGANPSDPPVGTAHPPPTDPGSRRRRSGSPYLWIPLGLALRAALALLAGETVLVADESNYLYLAMAWERFGVLLDTERYLWPPGYPLLVRTCLSTFGAAGEHVLHGVQVALSASIGWSAVRMAAGLFGIRAAHLAGALWALHLPLAAYTHLTWPETLFLALLMPTLVLALEAESGSSSAWKGDARLVAIGVLLGLATLVKEVALGLVPLLCAAIALRRGSEGALERLRRGSLPLCVVATLLAPWALRNQIAYGAFAPAGATLGENAYHGLNARYVNFDVRLVTRTQDEGERIGATPRGAFVVDHPELAWERSAERNTVRRSSENLRRGLAWVRAHPGDFLRSRLKKAADLVAPHSFLLRHLALDAYGGPLGSRALRAILVPWSLGAHLVVLTCAVLGAFAALRGRYAMLVLGVTALYFLCVGQLVAMSRFLIPLVPVAIVLAAGFLAAPRAGWTRRRAAGAGVALAVLLALWWIDLPEVLEMARLAWN